MVKPDRIGFKIDDAEQLCLERGELPGIDLAFEDGVLHALALVETGFGGLAQASSSGGIDGGDIIGYEHVHWWGGK